MKVVLDANVVIAAFATRGLCCALFELCLLEHRIILSEDLLHEISAGLLRKVKVPPAVADEILSLLKSHADIAKPKNLSAKVCRDPDDDKVLSLALEAKADYIITGDDDLLSLKEFQAIPILSVRAFWEILRK